MKTKAVVCALLCYVIWGSQALYWDLIEGLEPVFLLASRILFACGATWLYLLIAKRGREIGRLLLDWKKMRYILPAAVFVCGDWGLYIWAVQNGHVIDSNLGYYLNPLIIFLAGLFLFREKASGWEIAAIALAFAGIMAFTFMSGQFPLLSLVFAVVFPMYALLKKIADADPIVSICVETLVLSPFALGYIALFGRGEGGLASLTAIDLPLLLGTGVITATPMILYTTIVNRLPMKAVGIMQYLGTTIGIVCGALLLGERMTAAKWIILAFVWAGIVVFTVGEFRKAAKSAAPDAVGAGR